MIEDTPLMKAIEDATLAFRTATPFCIGNELPPGVTVAGYNRKVHRYAKKHGVPLDKAFAAIYGGKGK